MVVGSVAYDTVETTTGGANDALGGSAVYFSVAARFFAPVSVVGIVGSDFRPESRQILTDRGIDIRGLEQRPGKTFRWHGRYHEVALFAAMIGGTDRSAEIHDPR